MKKYILYILLAVVFSSCEKSEEFKPGTFPGFSGSGEYATWCVYKHTINDVAYLTTLLPTLTPATTYTDYNAAWLAARYKETSLFSFRLYKSGEVAVIKKDAQNLNIWVKQSDLKWEATSDYMYISRKTNDTWEKVIVVTPELEKMLCKFRKSYFGDNTESKDTFVMEALFTIYHFN